MKLVKETHKILHEKCNSFNFDKPIIDAKGLNNELQKIRKEGGGVGLAAPQVGINTQAFVIGIGGLSDEDAGDFNQIFFNPDITEYSEDMVIMIEGCLSYPRLFLKVKRPSSIVMTWYNEEGTKCYQKFSGMTARIIQHEIDHLEGITFQKRANRFHLNRALKERKLIERKRKKTYREEEKQWNK